MNLDYLLLSGLYRRPRSFTGSCATSGARGLYRRLGIAFAHPAPKVFIQFSIKVYYPLQKASTSGPNKMGEIKSSLKASPQPPLSRRKQYHMIYWPRSRNHAGQILYHTRFLTRRRVPEKTLRSREVRRKRRLNARSVICLMYQ